MPLDSCLIAKENDHVVIYQNARSMRRIKLTKGQIFSCKYGSYKHEEFIGQPFGKKITKAIKTKRGCNDWVALFEISPGLWPNVLNFRTQILYKTDISYILLRLNIEIGSFVVEAGTGSGVLSYFIANSVAPTGHLFTYEIDSNRVTESIRDFNDNGISEFVTIENRDVCENGFPEKRILFDHYSKKNKNREEIYLEETVPKNALDFAIDSVFLDVPNPWDCVDNVNKILKTSGMFCSFSPCIEQVQKIVSAMESSMFCQVETINLVDLGFSTGKTNQHGETFTRIFGDEFTHTGYLTFGRKM